MKPDEIFDILEDIPSDLDSEISDEDIGDNEVVGDHTPENVDLFDINAMDIIFGDDGDVAGVSNALSVECKHNNKHIEKWDSEDELPLATIRSEIVKNRFIWTKDIKNCVKTKKQFFETTGPDIPHNLESPTDIFSHLFTDDLVDHIVFQTNLYALQKSGGSSNSFSPTNSKEIKVFLAINLLMGVKRLPSYRDYWSSKLELRDSFISSSMSRDRFSWILGHFHFNDNSVQPKKGDQNFDKLYKIRPLLNKLSETFLSSYNPSEQQAIDESMIRFKGRSALRQYMPLKPIKRGYKVWIRANESGYVSQFQIYTGKVGDLTEKNLGARVVKDLSRTLVGKGHKLYFDNYFNSIELQKDLLSDIIYSCGTARKGRKNMPIDLLDDKNMNRGDSDWRVSENGIVCMKWKDRKGVLFFDNFHDPTELDKTSRKMKDGTSEEIICPVLVKDYNRHMGFVDKMDMLKSVYEIDRKSKKWWHRIAWYFLDVAMVNSYIIFKARSTSQSLSLKEFRMAVIMGLIGANLPLAKQGRKSTDISSNAFKITVPMEIRYDKCDHMPIHGNSRRCSYCSTRQNPHRTRWSCVRCGVGLCLTDKKNCFKLYHTK